MCTIDVRHVEVSLRAETRQNQVRLTNYRNQLAIVDADLLEVFADLLVFFGVWTQYRVMRALRGKYHGRRAAARFKGPVAITNRLLDGSKCARQRVPNAGFPSRGISGGPLRVYPQYP